MATQKRKRAGGRRRARARANPVNPVNPTRRRKSAKRRGRRSTVYARRRNPINPTRRRRFGRRKSRRRNPATGVLGKAFTLAAGGALIGLVQPFVGRFVMPYVGVSPLTNAGVAFGTGWLLSLAAGALAFTRRWKDDLLLAGGVVAAAQLISAYVVPMVRRFMPATGMGWRRGYANNGMRGIATIHGVPPHLLPPPLPQNRGMEGIAATAPGWGR